MTTQKTGKLIASLASGVVFGLGLAISGMTNTDRVQGFLDLAGQWDPTLAFVMGSGLIVAFVGYKWVLKNPAPLFAPAFSLPTKTDIDKPLLIGAILFGVGWGLVGYCPGPVLAGLSYGYTTTLVFAPTMIVGLLVARPLAKLF
tara:strand:- start:9240 stop:9671 length:432 start_codon:yes stop_codon:yes gene_type:complete